MSEFVRLTRGSGATVCIRISKINIFMDCDKGYFASFVDAGEDTFYVKETVDEILRLLEGPAPPPPLITLETPPAARQAVNNQGVVECSPGGTLIQEPPKGATI